MIKINLLRAAGAPAPKPPGPPTTAARSAMILGGALLVVAAIVVVLYIFWSRQVSDLETTLLKEQGEERRLAAIQAENERYKQQLAQLQQRNKTIDDLLGSRVGPVDLMTALGNTVNRTNDLYLLSVNPSGTRLIIKGQSNTVDSIAHFVLALKQSGSFDDIQLQQYFEDDMFGRPSYKFNLDCLYKLPPPPAAPAGQLGVAATRRAGM